MNTVKQVTFNQAKSTSGVRKVIFATEIWQKNAQINDLRITLRRYAKEKYCAGCEHIKPIELFGIRNDKKSGTTKSASQCLDCCNTSKDTKINKKNNLNLNHMTNENETLETSTELVDSFKAIEILLKGKDVTIAQLEKQVKELELKLSEKDNTILDEPKTTSSIKSFVQSKKPDTHKENIDFIVPLIFNKLIAMKIEPTVINGVDEFENDVLETEFEIAKDFIVW